MGIAVVLFSRDLRIHDNPALEAATERFEEVVPLFVLDDSLLGSANRAGAEAFLRQLCWRDFDLQLLGSRPDLPYADYRPRGDEAHGHRHAQPSPGTG